MIEIKRQKDGDYFYRVVSGVREDFYEISKEEYERVKGIEDYQTKLNREYEAIMDDCVRWGYGFYGCKLAEKDDKYYYVVCIGNSCD